MKVRTKVMRSILGKGLKFAKPRSRKSIKAQEDRFETALIKQVRAACVERDGHCRVAHWSLHIGACAGPSEWAHLGDKRRYRTVGMAPQDRHSTAWTAMLCKKHHESYDAHAFEIEYLSADGADRGIIVTEIDSSRMKEAHGKAGS